MRLLMLMRQGMRTLCVLYLVCSRELAHVYVLSADVSGLSPSDDRLRTGRDTRYL